MTQYWLEITDILDNKVVYENAFTTRDNALDELEDWDLELNTYTIEEITE